MIKKFLIDYEIRNKRALIVGGTKDLGKEISLQLLKSGCKIFIIGRDYARSLSLERISVL